jgi:antitoxin VapB
MERLQEINHKHDVLRALLQRHHSDGLWMCRPHNIAWFTAGADASIAIPSETGAYSLLVTAERRVVYTDNIEATRLHGEERFEDLGFEYVEFPWHERKQPELAAIISDDGTIEDEIQQLRWVLLESEQERFRALGRDAAAAIEEAARAVRAGDTEWEIAARLDAACKKRGGLAVVNLIATDERISRFRHPLATGRRLEKTAMLVVCMRRGGLVVSATRFVNIGPTSTELQEKLRKVASIDAVTMVASKPGRTLGQVIADLQQAYAAYGEGDQWKHHHQGGLAGYQPRERIATPGDATRLQAGHTCAWNPSLVGCKSEDTILVGANGFEIVTQASGDWPMIEVNLSGQIVKRPGILEI